MTRVWRSTTVLTIIAVGLLALSVALTVALFVVRTNDLSDIATDIQREVSGHAAADAAQEAVNRQAFCSLLTAYQVGSPSTEYGRELARRSRTLAVQFNCPGVS